MADAAAGVAALHRVLFDGTTWSEVIRLVLAVVGVLAVIDWLAILWRRHKDGIPGPFPLPLLRNALLLMDGVEHLHHIGERLHKTYGPIVRVWLPFHAPLVSVCDAEGMKRMLGIHGYRVFDRSPMELERFEEFLGGGLINTCNGPEWSRARSALAPAFHFESLAGLIPTVERLCNLLAARLQHAANTGQAVEMESEFLKFTFDVACSFTFGETCGALALDQNQLPTQLEAFNYLLQESQWRAFSPICYWKYVRTPAARKYTACLKVISDTIMAQIQRLDSALNANVTDIPNCVLLNCLRLRRQEGNEWMTDDVLVKHMVTFLFAGHDTTANMLLWTVYYLWRPENKKFLVQAQANVAAVLSPSAVMHADDLAKLGFITQVCKEALRLRPSIPLRGRHPIRSVELLNTIVMPDTQIAWNAYSAHRVEAQFPNASVFDPNRFSPENHHNLHPFAFVGFGAGPRRCIGEPLSLLEGAVVISRLVQQFNFKLAPGQVEEDVMYLTMRSAAGLRFLISCR